MLRALAFLTALLAGLAGAGSVRAAPAVDLALVLAVDVSASVDVERYDLQMRGYAEAFRTPELINAIRNVPTGAIAVTLVQWGSYGDQHQVIGWTTVRDMQTAGRFADAIQETGRSPADSTSLSGAIDFSAQLLRNGSAPAARRRAIDISGDGPNNSGRPVWLARDEAVKEGITINGLPILAREPTLDDYYEANVIGGPGAFMMVAEGYDVLATAILNKLTAEISGIAPPPGPRKQAARRP